MCKNIDFFSNYSEIYPKFCVFLQKNKSYEEKLRNDIFNFVTGASGIDATVCFGTKR